MEGGGEKLVMWSLLNDFEGGVGGGGSGFFICVVFWGGGELIFLDEDDCIFFNFVMIFFGLVIGLGLDCWFFVVEIDFWGIGGGFFIEGINIFVFWELILGKLYDDIILWEGIFIGEFEFFIELLMIFMWIVLWIEFVFIL